MVALIKVAENEELEQQSECERGKQRQHQRGQKIADKAVERHRQIGAQHVLDAVGEIDEVHHAEHQREAGRDQE